MSLCVCGCVRARAPAQRRANPHGTNCTTQPRRWIRMDPPPPRLPRKIGTVGRSTREDDGLKLEDSDGCRDNNNIMANTWSSAHPVEQSSRRRGKVGPWSFLSLCFFFLLLRFPALGNYSASVKPSWLDSSDGGTHGARLHTLMC